MITRILLTCLLACTLQAQSKTVREFGAAGDGTADDTAALQRAVDSGQGAVHLTRGRYRLTKPVVVDLDRVGPVSITGDGTATVLMEGAGPAFRFIGAHAGTASPTTVKDNVWLRQRTPMIDGFEIVGQHSEALGIEIQGTMQATISRLVVRRALHAIRLTGRNRNVIIAECHLYDNRGAGVLMEKLNLHQVNISNSHISYNGGGGVVARESEIRNLQIGTCDIEGNMEPGGAPTANVLIDVRKGSVREGAIVGSTLQHNHDSPDSANIRFLGSAEAPLKVGYFSISDNALSDVRVNIHLKHARGVSITGNSFWKGFDHDLLVEGSSNIVVGPNLFDRNPDYRPADSANGIVFRDTTDSTLTGLHLNGSLADRAALLLENCRRINITGATILNYANAGVWFDRTHNSRLASSIIESNREESVPVKVTGGGGNIIDGRPSADRYLSSVTRFADTVLARGRDTYGAKHTPLFVDGLEVETFEPARWKRLGETWVLSNLASQQPLMRTLDGLTILTGDAKYRRAAEDATRYALEHLRTPNGLLSWGGHMGWDLEGERSVAQYDGVHELKGQQPYFQLMWRVNAPATRRLMETMWATHILDWSRLDYNRHADGNKAIDPTWDHAFDETINVPFPSVGNNLSFVNVMPSLTHSGTMLAVLADNENAMRWTRRLVNRWQQGRDPNTGLCGGQLSYREHDRAQDALGHVHPGINEARIVASYHQTGRYHQLPLVEMQAGERLIAAGGDRLALGREFIDWASADLKAYAGHSYNRETGKFHAVMIDGAPIQWEQARTGYYNADSFAPIGPSGRTLWNFAMAYRLTKDEAHWDMVRELGRRLSLGDLGGAMRFDTEHEDLESIYALLELHRATGDDAMLRLASRIADNLLMLQTSTGLFPNRGRKYARTGDELPLAILHLVAAINGLRAEAPPPVVDGQFFHCIYDGPLEPHQQKRADKRTYDHLVFYGSR